MSKLNYSMIIFAVASALVSQLPAVAQQRIDPLSPQEQPRLLETNRGPTVTAQSTLSGDSSTRGRDPQSVQRARVPPSSHSFRGHVYHGQLAWEHGRWHHETHNGWYGWWWDVGGARYFYPEPIEGPPAYVSDTVAADEAGTASLQPQTAVSAGGAFYYQPGDLKGILYNSIEECWQARQKNGNVGVCVIK